MSRISKSARAATILLCATALAGCNVLSRLDDLGSAPRLSTIDNPTTHPLYKPVTMPMPAPFEGDRMPNSLWKPGARAFFKDQRASRVGDIITVSIDIKDSAKVANETKRSRDNEDTATLGAFFGLEGTINRILPGVPAGNTNGAVSMNSTLSNEGKGSVDRSEEIKLLVAAVITQVLPNGNLVLQGRQEIRINFEVRELLVSGIIRPEDILQTNTISYDKIAEARIAYGGRGQLTDVQQPRYGAQFIDMILPF
jgi:flagellar L-ring protein precursor FlgH